MSGLGGDPCGEECVDLIPSAIPLQFGQAETVNASNIVGTYSTRHDMCDVLCDNNLGYPLCKCNATKGLTKTADFFEGMFYYLFFFNYSKWL